MSGGALSKKKKENIKCLLLPSSSLTLSSAQAERAIFSEEFIIQSLKL